MNGAWWHVCTRSLNLWIFKADTTLQVKWLLLTIHGVWIVSGFELRKFPNPAEFKLSTSSVYTFNSSGKDLSHWFFFCPAMVAIFYRVRGQMGHYQDGKCPCKCPWPLWDTKRCRWSPERGAESLLCCFDDSNNVGEGVFFHEVPE